MASPIHRLLHRLFILNALCLALIGTRAYAAAEGPLAPPPVRVLLITGANNHDWKTTTPEITRILEESGRFTVRVLEQPKLMTAAMLAEHDVIVSDFNTFVGRYRDPRDPGWSDETKKAYIDFVQRGGGHVAVHAGSSSFYDWPEYQELVITSFHVGQTDHGTRHDFPVRIDVSEHPIMRGVTAFETFDELWHEAPIPKDATVLASAYSSKESRGSGHYEPIAMTKRFGEGRSFTLMLGHDVKAMRNAGFQALLTRGTEWAATGSVTLPVPTPWPSIAEDELPTNIDPLHWVRKDGAVALVDGDQVVWRFNHGAKAGKPHLHPLAPRGGPTLTGCRPSDHPWHYGLWFSWKFINGVNYWEEDRTTGAAEGRTEWIIRRLTTEENHTAHIELDVMYTPPESMTSGGGGEAVLTEQRVIDISAPDEHGDYAINWTMTFTAHVDLTLDRTPLPDEPGGKVYGGYAGLSARLAQDIDERSVVSSAGPTPFKDNRHRSRASAFEYNGVFGEQHAGIAIIDHHENLNAPTTWYAIKGPVMSFFSPAVICAGPHAMKAGEAFTLRYRVLVHHGAWDAQRLNAEAGRLTNDTTEAK